MHHKIVVLTEEGLFVVGPTTKLQFSILRASISARRWRRLMKRLCANQACCKCCRHYWQQRCLINCGCCQTIAHCHSYRAWLLVMIYTFQKRFDEARSISATINRAEKDKYNISMVRKSGVVSNAWCSTQSGCVLSAIFDEQISRSWKQKIQRTGSSCRAESLIGQQNAPRLTLLRWWSWYGVPGRVWFDRNFNLNSTVHRRQSARYSRYSWWSQASFGNGNNENSESCPAASNSHRLIVLQSTNLVSNHRLADSPAATSKLQMFKLLGLCAEAVCRPCLQDFSCSFWYQILRRHNLIPFMLIEFEAGGDHLGGNLTDICRYLNALGYCLLAIACAE